MTHTSVEKIVYTKQRSECSNVVYLVPFTQIRIISDINRLIRMDLM